MHQTEKQEHEGACEKPPPATNQPEHAPILSWIARLPKQGDDLLDPPDVIGHPGHHGGSPGIGVRVMGQFGFSSDRGAGMAEQNEDQDDGDANSNADQHLDDQRPQGEILTVPGGPRRRRLRPRSLLGD